MKNNKIDAFVKVTKGKLFVKITLLEILILHEIFLANLLKKIAKKRFLFCHFF